MAAAGSSTALVTSTLDWFTVHERALPWRRSTPWGVLVSEFMLQQTPVARVIPHWEHWLTRWPTASDLATAPLSDAIRAWGRLGYPRRARYLHEAAALIRDEHGGQVPDDEDALRLLPGVGEYTAAAVRAFAFGRRSIVLDTNVRRVLVRAVGGVARSPAALGPVERAAAEAIWPRSAARSARWSAAVMELGALVCTAREPDCGRCPISSQCLWLARGKPTDDVPRRRAQNYEGSDRQARGAVLAAARTGLEPLAIEAVTWPDDAQRNRALAGLLADGLLETAGPGLVRLPSGAAGR